MQTVLTIAGFDPSSGAGVTADLTVFAAHRLFGTACITALTVQSTLGVASTHPVAPKIVRATLECLHADLPPAGIKIGMLGTAANVAAVADWLGGIRKSEAETGSPGIPVVLDPVLSSTSGRELLDPEGVVLLRERLLPLVDWVTPNLAELAILSGEAVSRRADLPGACQTLQALVVRHDPHRVLAVFATGGHLAPPDDYLRLADGQELWIPGKRVQTRSTHGTGCALSSALLSGLVLGETPVQAAPAAKRYVAESLRTAEPRGSGNGPMNLLHPILQVTN